MDRFIPLTKYLATECNAQYIVNRGLVNQLDTQDEHIKHLNYTIAELIDQRDSLLMDRNRMFHELCDLDDSYAQLHAHANNTDIFAFEIFTAARSSNRRLLDIHNYVMNNCTGNTIMENGLREMVMLPRPIRLQRPRRALERRVQQIRRNHTPASYAAHLERAELLSEEILESSSEESDNE